MTASTTPRSSAYSATTVPSGWDHIPCVQYGFPDGKGPKRAPKLRTIFDPIPDNAETASPVYLLSRDQNERQQGLDSGWAVAGEYNSIATEIQDECETDDRVIYPVHIESDKLRVEGPQTLFEWFRKFVEDNLGVPFHACRLYYSGRRSIHVHVPRFVKSERQREALKSEAESFCEETGAKLDCGIYSTKRLFRLPGVKHNKTGFPKVEVKREWDDTRLLKEVQNGGPGLSDSYAEVLQDVFSGVTQGTAQSSTDEPHALFSRLLNTDAAVLELASDEREIEIPLIEGEYPKGDRSAVPKWAQYNSKEFSPYANSTGNPRSIAALRVRGGEFARKEKRNGATMVPAYFYGAVGCDGKFTKEQEHAPLQLSKPDYRKWDATPGDYIVVLGGGSNESRIFDVEIPQARHVGAALNNDEISRASVLKYLSGEGYEVGSAGSASSNSSSGGESPDAPKHIWPARADPQSDAERLQRQAEQDGIETLTHIERGRVACRHLRQGWQPTWEWFEEQYGSEFKPGVTWENLRSVVEQYGYDDVDVPPNPV